jgi:hypothetical protein
MIKRLLLLVHFSLFLLIVGMCASLNLFISGLDVSNAYLESRSDFRNDIRLPPELNPNEGRYEVIVALYGENNRAIVGQMFGVHYD